LQFSCENAYDTIILPHSWRKYAAIINAKKYYGLLQLANQHDYIAVFDAETLFIKDADLEKIYTEIGSSTTYRANKSKKGGEIIFRIATILGLQENEDLILQTENFTLYWWFNEIPVYDTKAFLEFWEWIEINKLKEKILEDYWCFDFLAYSVWCICFKAHTIIKVLDDEFIWGAVESTQLKLYLSDLNEKFSSYWAVDSPIDKTILLFHQDSIKT
jgi:hypothetical protein